jgi:hypothetical protein
MRVCNGLQDNIIQCLSFNMSVHVTYHNIFHTSLEFLQSESVFVPYFIHTKAWGDRRYSSYCFLSSALEGGEWSASRPGRALPPGKEPPVPTV